MIRRNKKVCTSCRRRNPGRVYQLPNGTIGIAYYSEQTKELATLNKVRIRLYEDLDKDKVKPIKDANGNIKIITIEIGQLKPIGLFM